jgi:hypothetical protein
MEISQHNAGPLPRFFTLRIPKRYLEHSRFRRYWVKDKAGRFHRTEYQRTPSLLLSIGRTFASGPYQELCAKPTRQGLTSRADAYPDTEAGSPEGFSYASFKRHMLLYPKPFANEAGRGHRSQPTVTGLVTSVNYPNVGDARSMDRFVTLSCTLYHELFNIVDATGSDADNGRT